MQQERRRWSIGESKPHFFGRTPPLHVSNFIKFSTRYKFFSLKIAARHVFARCGLEGGDGKFPDINFSPFFLVLRLTRHLSFTSL